VGDGYRAAHALGLEEIIRGDEVSGLAGVNAVAADEGELRGLGLEATIERSHRRVQIDELSAGLGGDNASSAPELGEGIVATGQVGFVFAHGVIERRGRKQDHATADALETSGDLAEIFVVGGDSGGVPRFQFG